jgi:hypothetical protein
MSVPRPSSFPLPSRRTLARGLAAFRVVAWFDLAFGLLILGYAVSAEPTLKLFRGAALLVGLGVLGLLQSRKWRRIFEGGA